MKYLLPILFLTSSLLIQAQNIKRSSFGLSGASEIVAHNNTTYFISQSIGQNSLIGTFSSQGATIRQGFQQPNVNSKINVTKLNAKVFPNPTNQYLNIELNNIKESLVFISLYDSYGRCLLKENLNSLKANTLDLSSYSSGIYFLNIFSENKSFVAQIIKL